MVGSARCVHEARSAGLRGGARRCRLTPNELLAYYKARYFTNLEQKHIAGRQSGSDIGERLECVESRSLCADGFDLFFMGTAAVAVAAAAVVTQTCVFGWRQFGPRPRPPIGIELITDNLGRAAGQQDLRRVQDEWRRRHRTTAAPVFVRPLISRHLRWRRFQLNAFRGHA
jgi:hypothetical protein